MTEGNGGRPTRTLRTEALARVEGEGAMRVRVRDGEVLDVQLQIYEPPRLFEGLLQGRALGEAPDITARICGICPVAYQMSACEAMEDALGIELDGPLRNLRRLIYCGEWIESHTLHLYLLHAPDFLGYESGFEMARDHAEIVERGLRTKKAGNALIAAVGGREVHPINVRVGVFTVPPIAASWSPFERPWSARGKRRWRRSAGRRRFRSPSSSATTSSSPCARRSPPSTRSTAAGSSPRRGSTSMRASSTGSSPRSTSSTRPRFTPT